jgi:hypothetical protein
MSRAGSLSVPAGERTSADRKYWGAAAEDWDYDAKKLTSMVGPRSQPCSESGARSKGRCQPGKLRVQAQTGLVGRFRRRAGTFGYRGNQGLELAEAQIAGVGSAPTGPELAALFDGFAE